MKSGVFFSVVVMTAVSIQSFGEPVGGKDEDKPVTQPAHVETQLLATGAEEVSKPRRPSYSVDPRVAAHQLKANPASEENIFVSSFPRQYKSVEVYYARFLQFAKKAQIAKSIHEDEMHRKEKIALKASEIHNFVSVTNLDHLVAEIRDISRRTGKKNFNTLVIAASGVAGADMMLERDTLGVHNPDGVRKFMKALNDEGITFKNIQLLGYATAAGRDGQGLMKMLSSSLNGKPTVYAYTGMVQFDLIRGAVGHGDVVGVKGNAVTRFPKSK